MSVRLPSASLLVMLAVAGGWAGSARAGLDDYLKKPEPAFAWSVVSSNESDGVAVHRLKLTSQVWQGITWTHDLTIIEPSEMAHPNAALLFITGGTNGDAPRAGDVVAGLAMANACRSRVVVLPQVPNQPLLGDKREDALIAETFVRYLEARDEEWPLLFPMVKSAVKAMDAVQAFAKDRGKPIADFVVAGASKRGWTTWLTGASDPRVKAIAPMVIPTLNLNAQTEHQLEMFDGKYSEQIRDYTERGIVGKKDPASTRLLELVDPFTYRARLTLPKLQINGTNDPYWTLDSMNLYWDDLVGPKWVVYLPNAGHGLDQHRDYAIQGIGALFRHAIGGTPFPKLSWRFDDKDGKVQLAVESDIAPRSAQVWTATSDTLDFRKSPWTSERLDPSRTMTIARPNPDVGHLAVFADLEYEVDGFSYHLSTQIHQTNGRPAAR